MEKKLEKLFDYQKFENDAELNNIINSVLDEGVALTDEDLSMVNAAGEPAVNNKKPLIKEEKKEKNYEFYNRTNRKSKEL